MFVFAAISPGLALPAHSEVPHTLGPRADLASTLAVLVVGLLLIAGAIRTVIKQ